MMAGAAPISVPARLRWLVADRDLESLEVLLEDEGELLECVPTLFRPEARGNDPDELAGQADDDAATPIAVHEILPRDRADGSNRCRQAPRARPTRLAT